MNKLAYLNSTLQGPELVTSINGVKLSQEEHQFFAEVWTEMNKLYEKEQVLNLLIICLKEHN